MNPYSLFGLLGLGGVVLAAILLSPFTGGIVAWFIAINASALAIYRFDKSLAQSGKLRVPELILLLMEALGGTVGVVIAMWFIRPRHKIQSGGFLLWFFLILLLQVAGVIAFLYFYKA